jgi:hypothetical protein
VNQSRWTAWLAVGIPVVVLFGPVLVSDRTFAFRDSAHFYYPLFEWCADQWGAGRVPLWNPQENIGVPALADTSSSLFYPGKLLFALPLDFTLKYKLYVTLHVLLAAGGSYWLARVWQCSRYAGALAAVTLACGGGVVFQYSNIVFLVGAAWLPFAALATDWMLHARSWRAAVLLGAVLALMILGGDPQMALNALLAAGMYAVVRCFSQSEETQSQPPGRTSRIRLLGLSSGLVGAAAVVGFLLAAVQILPSSEATKYSERAAFNRPRNVYEVARLLAQSDAVQPHGESRNEAIVRGLFGPPEPGHPTLAYDFSVGPWRLAEYFWPNVGGRMFPTGRRWFSLIPAETRTWTPTLYLGLLPLLLGLSCFRLWSASAKQKWLSWLVLFFTLATFGTYGLGWVAREIYAACGGNAENFPVGNPVGGVYWLMVTLLPSYAYFRYPAKLLPLVSLGLAQLAAIGWDRAFAERRPWLLRCVGLFAIASGISLIVAWSISHRFILEFGNRPPDASLGPFDVQGAMADVYGALFHGLVVSAAIWWILREAWSDSAKARHWQTAALLLAAVELAVANYWLAPTVPADSIRSEPPVAAAIEADRRTETHETANRLPRVYRGSLARWRPQSFRKSASANRVAETAVWEHDTLFPKYQLDSDLALVESYGSIKLADYETLLFMARQYGPPQPDGSRLPQPTALRLLGTEYLVLSEGSAPAFAERVDVDPGKRPADWPEDASLWRMKRTLPRAWIVHDMEVLAPLPFPLRLAEVDERTKEVLFPGGKARDFSRSAVVETDDTLPENDAATQPATSDESCRITAYEPTHVVVEARLAQPGLVVLSDAWFPGWEATVSTAGVGHSGPQTATIHRTNRVMRGVWVPAGKNQIEFHYRPRNIAVGAILSLVGWSIMWLWLAGPPLGLIRRQIAKAIKSNNSAPA